MFWDNVIRRNNSILTPIKQPGFTTGEVFVDNVAIVPAFKAILLMIVIAPQIKPCHNP